MSSDASLHDEESREPLTTVPGEWCEILRHPRRIRLLEVLRNADSPLSLADLATAVHELEGDETATRDDVRLELVHNHLPRLDEHGVVDWADDAVTLVAEPPVDPAALLAALNHGDGASARGLLAVFADPVRIRINDVLARHERPLTVDRLASELRDRSDDADVTTVALYHAHLPALADAGLLEFDHDEGLVSPVDRDVPIA